MAFFPAVNDVAEAVQLFYEVGMGAAIDIGLCVCVVCVLLGSVQILIGLMI